VYYLYILECEDGSLYTGITTDIARRFNEHSSGVGSRYAGAHVPKKIVYSEKHASRSEASKREAEIKSWPRNKKIEIISRGT